MPLPVPLRTVRSALAGPGRRPAWRRRVLRKALAVALAVLAALIAVRLVSPPAPEPRVEVPVAARDLPAGTVLAAGDIETVSVPASLAGATGSAPRSSPAGQVLAGAVERGEPLRATRLLRPGILRALDASQVAVAVPVPSGATASTLQVGARVDVILGGRVVAPDVVVLAVTRPPATADRLAGVTGAVPGEVLLAVPRTIAPTLSATHGDISTTLGVEIALRPPGRANESTL